MFFLSVFCEENAMRKYSLYCLLVVVLQFMGGSLSAATIEHNQKWQQQGKIIPRVILAFYDGKQQKSWFTRAHRIAEMPLNHLGLIVQHHDLRQPLPDPKQMAKVRGILLWFESNAMPDPRTFLQWLLKAMDAGKPVAVLGEHGFLQDLEGNAAPKFLLNAFWKRMKVKIKDDWVKFTYNASPIAKDASMVEYERPLQGVLPSFTINRPIDNRVKSYLVVRDGANQATESHLVMLGPKHGFIASGYAVFESQDFTQLQWRINPFRFFRHVFRTVNLPKPDTTTMNNRRIYYSHIDGDGWRNRAEMKRYTKMQTLSSEVILREVIEPYPDLPVTVGPVVADLHPDWYGTEETVAIAKEMLALPQVEAATHTFSHPLDWGFFAKGDLVAKERPFLKFYPSREFLQSANDRFLKAIGIKKKNQTPPYDTARWRQVKARARKEKKAKNGKLEKLSSTHYRTPRAFAVIPFDLTLEIEGAIDFVQDLLPPGKKVALVQWSGNTLPYEEVLRKTRLAGVRNINGGDTRFDQKYASVAWVAPLGRRVGQEQQVYASNSNENTYTNLWTEHFFGFKHLVRTVLNTETPMRLKPFNVYYHIYSGEKQASLNAVLENLNFARTLPIAPVTTSHFAAIVEGFISAELEQVLPQSYRVLNRGLLQTIRFDQATFKAVDFSRSKGVLGQKWYQGSLYIALDAQEPAPIITLKEQEQADQLPKESTPYLIESRWQIWDFTVTAQKQMQFQAQGFGQGDMHWFMGDMLQKQYQVMLYDQNGKLLHQEVYQANNQQQSVVDFKLPDLANQAIKVTVIPMKFGK